MRRINPKRGGAFGVVAALLILVLSGAGLPKKKTEPPPLKTEETLLTLAYVKTAETQVEGVGLVIGLNGTGANAPPSTLRADLVEEMRKAGVDHPEKWLERKDTSMVIVRAIIPSGINTSDAIDVNVELPPGSATTSLAGGKLLVTQLRQVARTPDQGLKKSNTIATAGGPLMAGSSAAPTNVKIARVLGGARVKKEVPYTMIVREDRKSVRTVKLVEDVIKQRFHESDGIDQKGRAAGKTDQVLILKVPKVYHHNQTRYFQVVQGLHVVDSPPLRAQRLERWSKELLDSKTAGRAALKLEGLGGNAIPALKTGLESTDLHVKYFAAESLAFLGDPSGAEVLSQAAIRDKELRAAALKALAAMDQSAALMKLRALLSQADVELRYGAFDALRTADPTDPFLGRISVYDDPPEVDQDDLKFQLDSAPQRRKPLRPEDPFTLYVVDCEGPPMVHVSRNLRCEIVVFVKGQSLLPPLVLGAGGPILLNAAEGDQLLQISRIDVGTLDGPGSRVTAPLELSSAIRQVAQLGATYPDIVEILSGAFRQKNLPGPLVVDAIPLTGKSYDEALLIGKTKKDDAVKKTSAEAQPKKYRVFSRLRNLMER